LALDCIFMVEHSVVKYFVGGLIILIVAIVLIIMGFMFGLYSFTISGIILFIVLICDSLGILCLCYLKRK